MIFCSTETCSDHYKLDELMIKVNKNCESRKKQQRISCLWLPNLTLLQLLSTQNIYRISWHLMSLYIALVFYITNTYQTLIRYFRCCFACLRPMFFQCKTLSAGHCFYFFNLCIWAHLLIIIAKNMTQFVLNYMLCFNLDSTYVLNINIRALVRFYLHNYLIGNLFMFFGA